MVEVKTKKSSKETPPILITENKNIQPLLGLDRMDKLKIGLQGNRNTNIIQKIKAERRKRLINEYEDLFKNNHTIKDLTIDIQLKKKFKITTTKGTASTQSLPKNSATRTRKCFRERTPRKGRQNIWEFLRITRCYYQKERQVGWNSIGFGKLERGLCQKEAASPNMEELSSQMSAEITKSEAKIWKPKIDLDYKQGQAKQSKEAAKPCVFSIIRDDYTGHCRFKKGLYGLSDFPTVIREHIDKVLEFKKIFLLDDIICVTNGTIEDNEREVREVSSKLQNAEYHASDNIELFKRELTWLSYYINLDGVKPKRQNWYHYETGSTKERQRIKIISGFNSSSV